MISWLFHILVSAKNFQLTDTKRFDELKFRYKRFFFHSLAQIFKEFERKSGIMLNEMVCICMQSYCKTSMQMGFIFTKNIETIYIFHLIMEFHSLALRKMNHFDEILFE